jgi:acyl-CoA synthetase (AMP-forming)/AMP-acid ligase II
VGRKFESIEWRVIRITDYPIATINDVEDLPQGEIGEVILRGPQVSPSYATRIEANAAAKIGNGSSTEYLVRATQGNGHSPFPTSHSPLPLPWHRTGDVGYIDDRGRFWYCGRKSQRIVTREGTLYTECVEAVVNRDPEVRRSALVGIGPLGRQVPVIVAELSGNRVNRGNSSLLESLQSQQSTRQIQAVLFRHALPVDIRHNAKINREYLAAWAARRLPELG